MSIKRKVSIQHSVFNLLDDIGGQDHKMVPVLTRWATDADQKIKSFYAYKYKQVVLTVVGCEAELPCNAVSVEMVVRGDYGCDCGMMFNDLISRYGIAKANVESTANFLVIDIGGSGPPCMLRWRIQNNKLIFFGNGNLDGQKITIQILSYETDENGFILVNENHVDAISAYMEWKLAKRTRWNKKLGNISEQGIRGLYFDWSRLCAECRADDESDNNEDRNDIRDMINDPVTGGHSEGFWLY